MQSAIRLVVRELFETIILALLIFLALHFSLRNYQVEGSSMQPTLEPGEYVLVNKLVYLRFQMQELAGMIPYLDVESQGSLFTFHPPQRGEVIIFRYCSHNQEQLPGCPNDSPGLSQRDFVKRVVAVEGDRLDVIGGKLYVNGREQDGATVGSTSNIPAVVPDDRYFVLGDNRQASNDSRRWGTVPAENVIGRAWFTFWPLGRWGPFDPVP